MTSDDMDATSGSALDILRRLAISADGETPDVLFGHSVELYCEGGSTVEKRRAMVDLIGDYRRLMDGAVTHFHPRDSRRLRAVEGDAWREEATRLAETLGPDDDEGFDATLYGFPGGKDEDEATAVFCCVIGAPSYQRFSSANAYFPADFFERGDNYETYIDLMRRWCGLLRVAHGTAGFSLVLEEGQPKSRAILLAFPLLKRFPGLDLPNGSRWSSAVRRAPERRIRSFNWLTAIDDGFVEELGGVARMRDALGDACPLHAYEGGLLIQAGPRPEIGDRNAGTVPEHYRTVAQLLKPLVFEDFNPKLPYLNAPKPLDSHDETIKWLRRFD